MTHQPVVRLETVALPSGNNSTSPARTILTAESTRPLHSGRVSFALAAISATASRHALRAGFSKSGAEASSQVISPTATMILTSIYSVGGCEGQGVYFLAERGALAFLLATSMVKYYHSLYGMSSKYLLCMRLSWYMVNAYA